MIVGKMSSVSPAYSDHWLVESIDHSLNTYTTYTCSGDKVAKMERKWKGDDKTVFRIDYGGGADIYSAGKAIENARIEYQYHKWNSSDEFVTLMKTGKCYSLAQQCLFSPDNNIVGYTPITPDIAVDEGDHIILQDALDMYHSVYLYKNITGYTTAYTTLMLLYK